jgi:hypothetical protein
VRRRSAIILEAVVIAGGFAALFYPWNESRTEYHIRKYLDAEKEAHGQTFTQRVGAMWRNWIGDSSQRWMDMSNPNNPYARMDRHEQALIHLGYLEKREFYLTNIAGRRVAYELQVVASKGLDDQMWRAYSFEPETNKIEVRARRVDMRKWEEMVRKVDAGN